MLLHICCATCAAYVLDFLKTDYDASAYYYNPNIYPDSEYEIRKCEAQGFCAKYGIPFIESVPDRERWFAQTAGHEDDPERGDRCTICYRMRLESTARHAAAHGFEIFGTDLSISPHKDAERLNAIGAILAEQYGIAYYSADFKKNDGFTKAMARSREENFYRQNYCGCIYSLASMKNRLNKA